MFEKLKIKKAKRLLMKEIEPMIKEGIDNESIIKKFKKKGKNKEMIEEIIKEIIEKDKDKIEIRIPIIKKKVKDIEDEIAEPEKPKGLKEKVDELSDAMDVIMNKDKQIEKLKKKKFKVPRGVKSQLKKLAIKNKVQVMLLQRTRNIKPVIGEIRDGMLLVGNQVYNGAVDSTWLWEGKFPTHIVPEWDLQPMTPEGISKMRNTNPITATELYNDCIKNSRSSEPQKIILRAMEAKENQMLKKPVNVKTIVLVIVVTIIVMAVLFGGKII